MLNPEYMRILWKYIPEDIRIRYGLHEKLADDGYIYVKIKKGMYGLKQAAVLAFDNLVHNLSKHGYTPCPNTLGIWRHTTRKTKFCLCVDDFGVKYYSKADAQHLLDSLSEKYTHTVDWQGQNFCGLRLEWNYVKNYVDVWMPNYIKEVLHRFKHPSPPSPQYSPHEHTPIQYGNKNDNMH